jgi:AcrR family transcriptional regulator
MARSGLEWLMVKAAQDAVLAGEAAKAGRGAVRRAQIMEAATALLLEEGHGGFSVRGVAARAGIGLSHVQYYFPTPASIIGALLDQFIEQYARDVLGRFRDGVGPARARLASALEFLLNDEAYRDQCSVFMAEVTAIAQRDAQIAASVTRYYDVYQSAVDSMARELNPALPASQRRRRVQQCVALIEGMAATRRYLGSDADRAFSAKAAAQAIELLLRGATPDRP